MKIETLADDAYEAAIRQAKQYVYQTKERNTFGILDPDTGQKYPDILSSHIEARTLQLEDWLFVKSITESAGRKENYKLLLDHKALKKLLRQGYLDAIISFQKRTSGLFAVVRIFDKNKVHTRDSI